MAGVQDWTELAERDLANIEPFETRYAVALFLARYATEPTSKSAQSWWTDQSNGIFETRCTQRNPSTESDWDTPEDLAGRWIARCRAHGGFRRPITVLRIGLQTFDS